MGRSTSRVRGAGPADRSGPTYAWRALMVGGVALIGVGGYFLFLRPPLLPEDGRYMGMSLPDVMAAVPGLRNCLPKVFTVLGGYIASVGVLTCYVAGSGLRTRTPGALAAASLSGAMSVGLMVAVNFAIHSDFRWVLVLLIVPWLSAGLLYWWEGTWTTVRAG